MVSPIIRRIRSLRRRVFPTPIEREVQRFFVENPRQNIRYAYDLPPKPVIVDVGGYLGDWTAEMVARFDARAYIFEPIATFVERITARFRHNPNVVVIPQGLGGSTRTERIASLGDASSIIPNSTSPADGKAVDIVDVYQWFTECGSPTIHVMKINIEGAEYELIDRMVSIGMLPHIDNIQVQFHSNVSGAQTDRFRIHSELPRTHHMTFCYPFVWENWGITASET